MLRERLPEAGKTNLMPLMVVVFAPTPGAGKPPG